jgi:hypothetical protein
MLFPDARVIFPKTRHVISKVCQMLDLRLANGRDLSPYMILFFVAVKASLLQDIFVSLLLEIIDLVRLLCVNTSQ